MNYGMLLNLFYSTGWSPNPSSHIDDLSFSKPLIVISPPSNEYFTSRHCLFLRLYTDSVLSLHPSSPFWNQIHSYAQNCTPLCTRHVRKALETSINYHFLSLLAFLLVLSLVLCLQLSYKFPALWSSVDLLPSTGPALLSLLVYTPRLVCPIPNDLARLPLPIDSRCATLAFGVS